VTVREWPASGPLLAGLLCLLVLLGGFGAWAVGARLSGAVIARGEVEPEGSRQVIQHPDGGVVAAVAVRDGDRVAAGDLLLRLDGAGLGSDLAVVEGRLLELLARRARLEAEEAGADALAFDPLLRDSPNPAAAGLRAGAEALFAARAETFAQGVAQLREIAARTDDQVAGIAAQREAAQAQLALLAPEIAARRALRDDGLVPAAALLDLEREEAALRGRLGELQAAAALAASRGAEAEMEILRLGSERREAASQSLRDLEAAEIELGERRRALLRQLDRLEIRAPVAGLVHGMAVTAPRQVVRAAEPLLSLVPEGRPLVVTTALDPADVDEVTPGQEVRLQLPALDRRQAPELHGRVLRVSADAFRDERTGRSFFRAEIGLGESLPEGVALLPGMPVEAFIVTGERAPIDYLLRPLTATLARAFREG
jgi:HlyD family type I secretion membrane fusion protein